MSKNPEQADRETAAAPESAETDRALLDRLRPQLDRLPIFPLRDVHLFPSSLLPLYVFEGRYREMTAACLEAGGAMAVATLVPGFEAEYHRRPPVRPVAGAGLIVAHRKNADGTYHILLRGVSRCRLAEELPPERAFRQARAVLVPDELPADGDLADARGALLALVDRLAHDAPEVAESLHVLCDDARGPAQLTDVLAASLVQDPALRQELLETASVPARLELLTAEIARLASRLPGRAESN